MLKPILVLALSVLPLSAGSREPQHPVNLNSASVTELMQLPHVGLKTAERIVAFRKEHGGFRRPEELMNVKGIGEKSFTRLKPFVSASGAPAKPAAAAARK